MWLASMVKAMIRISAPQISADQWQELVLSSFSG